MPEGLNFDHLFAPFCTAPENPYGSSANAEIASRFNQNVADSYGVRNTSLNLGRSITEVSLSGRTNNELVKPSDMISSTSSQAQANLIADHNNHTHVEMNRTVRGVRSNDPSVLQNYQRDWLNIQSPNNPWTSL